VTGSRSAFGIAALALLIVAGTGCSAITSSMTGSMSESLANSMLNQNDPQTVRDGAPAYLLMIDGFIADAPDNPNLLMAGARLYSSYASAFVDDPTRAALMSNKAKRYGLHALCVTDDRTCDIWEQPFDEFEAVINKIPADDIEPLFVAAAAWATWVKANSEDWVAVADKARVETMMLHVTSLDPEYNQGTTYLYLGVLATLLPEALGGKPEEGRVYFERAIELSDGRDLMAKTLLARDYARLVFDRELHDRLCREVIDADPVEEGLTLSNTLAQEEARFLLDDSEDYFGE